MRFLLNNLIECVHTHESGTYSHITSPLGAGMFSAFSLAASEVFIINYDNFAKQKV